MQRLSNNATLFFKMFIPVFMTTIMLGLTLVAWFDASVRFTGFPLNEFRYAITVTLVLSIAVFWLVLWPLKRVEADEKRVYVSNYFRTVAYRWAEDVDFLRQDRLLLVKIATLELKGPGSFGKRVRFLPSKKLLRGFQAEHPGLVPLLNDNGTTID